jgi:N-acetylglucosaminyldiphosphoundecaprenol N-acetyl-beta-D-mannosaminyltransferase
VNSGRRVRLIDLEVDAVKEGEVIAAIMRGLADGRGGWVVTPNLDQLRQRTKRTALAAVFDRADLVVADGMPLVWASRLQGTPLPERVAGSDLVWSLAAEAALRGKSVFLLGGAPGACDAAGAKLRRVYPGLRIAGSHCPPMGFERDAHELDRITSALRDTQPDIVYVGLGFPKQERLIAYLRSEFPGAWFLGVGYSLSFIAGHTSRAPAWMMRLGLEWMHRLIKEPRRLARRYLAHDLPFAAHLFAHALHARATGRHADAGSPVGAGATSRESASERVVFASGSIERERAKLLAELLEPE